MVRVIREPGTPEVPCVVLSVPSSPNLKVAQSSHQRLVRRPTTPRMARPTSVIYECLHVRFAFPRRAFEAGVSERYLEMKLLSHTMNALVDNVPRRRRDDQWRCAASSCGNVMRVSSPRSIHFVVARPARSMSSFDAKKSYGDTSRRQSVAPDAIGWPRGSAPSHA